MVSLKLQFTVGNFPSWFWIVNNNCVVPKFLCSLWYCWCCGLRFADLAFQLQFFFTYQKLHFRFWLGPCGTNLRSCFKCCLRFCGGKISLVVSTAVPHTAPSMASVHLCNCLSVSPFFPFQTGLWNFCPQWWARTEHITFTELGTFGIFEFFH